MPKIKIKKKKTTLHPIMTYCILIVITLILSGILGLIGVSSEYNSINALRGYVETKSIQVIPLFTLSGLKLIFRTTVNNFITFAPLSMLIITLIGIGIMDKSGFLEAFFTLITKKASKFRVTLSLSFILVISSIISSVRRDMCFVIFIPIIALFFKYSKRNPKVGIVLAFAGLTSGYGINIFMNSIDSVINNYTRLAASSLDNTYTISPFGYLYIMIILTIIMSIAIALITEYVVVPKFGKYEVEENREEFYLSKESKKGLFFSLLLGGIYLLIFIYNIIPNLPLSGNLLDYTQTFYIDKLFGEKSFFDQGFVFIVTTLFFILGFTYGIVSKTIKNNRDITDYLGHSLDGIGKTLVLIFFASTFISIFNASKIGLVLVSFITNMFANSNLTGIPLILITFILMIIISLLVPPTVAMSKMPVSSWAILSNSIVPIYMKAGLSAELATLVYRAASSIAYGLTPVMAYSVIYLAFLDNYSEEDKPIKLFGAFKLILPYAGISTIIWLIVIILFNIIGIPLGINTPTVL